MNALIVGTGQLAWDLMQTAPASVNARMVGRADLDIRLSGACETVLAAHKPDIVINAAAYTAVDKAEAEREAAFAVNEQGVANLADACQQVGARLFHVSTDFVFDGEKNTPYLPGDKANPQCVYGASKLAGEAVLRQRMPDAVIVRTGWLYSCNGGNFVKTMLRLMADGVGCNGGSGGHADLGSRFSAAALVRCDTGGAWWGVPLVGCGCGVLV